MKKLYFSIVFILLLSTNTFAQIPTLTIGNVSFFEGSGTAIVPIFLSEISSIDTVIDIATTTGTASFSDYTTTFITLTIPAGQTSTSVSIPIIDDIINEADETFTVNGTVLSGNTVNNTAFGTVTIIDNNSTPIISIANVTVNEGNGTVIVPITLSGPSAFDTVVNIVTTSGSANTSDYISISYFLVISAEQTTTSVTITIIDDLIVEPNETFTIDTTIIAGIIANTNASGTVTIIDNDVLSANNFSFDNIVCYPNPVKNSFEIKNSSDIETVEIFSLNGQKVYENSINAIYTKIDTSNFSKGIYVVKVKASGEEKIIKLVKE